MEKRNLFAITAVGLAAAIAVPTIAFGNARNNQGIGTLHELHVAQTPFVAQMTGANEVPPVTTTATGAATVTFDITDATDPLAGAQVCWDLSYSGIVGNPTAAHIHRGVAGEAPANNIVVPLFTAPGTGVGATSATGCADMDPALALEIMTTPANFYVNVHSLAHGGGEIRGQLAAAPAPAGEAHLLAVPLRAYDSRVPTGAAKIVPNETRTISLASGKDAAGTSFIAVPPGATAAIVTLTVTETTIGKGGNGGFLTMYSAALATQPATSSINWAGVDQNVAVTTQVAVDASGEVKVAGGANDTHFVIDVIGYLF